jgi:hypothetical protein
MRELYPDLGNPTALIVSAVTAFERARGGE